MPIPFLNSIKLNKNQVEDFCVFNYSGDPTLSSGADFGYLWLNTSATPKVLKFWDGTNYRTLIDSTTISSSTAGTANDLSGGVAGSLPYQQGVGDTTFLGIGSSGYILTSTGSAPQWSASIPSTSVSGLAASATTDTTNASNISSGTLGLARLSLATDQFYVGDASNNPAATAKSSIPLSGFGAAGADVAMGGFKITGLGTPTASTDAANKDYVDSVAQGLDVKASCLVATTTDITLASPGAVTIDGIYSATDFTAGTTRILVKDQSASAENGIYIWQGPAAAMTRSADANTWDELVGAFTFVERGTANADSGWVCTVNAGGTLGSTAVTWVKFSQAGSYTQGRGMVLDGTAFNFAQNTDYTAGRIPFASGPTTIGFNANLHWDNFNNRLGIGTATPASALDVVGTGIISQNLGIGAAPSYKLHVTQGDLNSYVVFQNNQTLAQYRSMQMVLGNGPSVFGANNRDWRVLNVASSATASDFVVDYWTGTAISEKFKIASDGVFTWSNVVNAGTAMTLNGNGLGIGGGPVAPDGASRTFQIGSSTVIQTPVGEQTSFSNNTYYDGTSWKRIVANRFCNSIRFNGLGNNGDITFSCAGTGAANSVLTNWDTSDVKMVLNYLGNLGIGTATPSAKLQVMGLLAVQDAAISFPTSGVGLEIYYSSTNSSSYIQSYNRTGSAFVKTTYNALSHQWDLSGGGGMVLTSSGNLGLGVTPSAWVGGKAFQLGSAIADASLSGLGDDTNIATNAYYNAGWKYINGGYTAARYRQSGGIHSWFTAPAGGSNGAAITFTQAMTLDASGNLLVGTASNLITSTVRLHIEGSQGIVSKSTGGFAYYPLVLWNTATSGDNVFAAFGTEASYTARFSLTYNRTANALSINATEAAGGISLTTGSSVERLRIKSTGQVNFVGLASDPAGAAGDVYYNSGSNVFKVYDTGWKTLPRKYVVQLSDGSVTVLGNAYTITHNLGSQDVTVSIRRTTDNAVVQADVVMPAGGNTVTVTFAAAITAAQFYVTVIG